MPKHIQSPFLEFQRDARRRFIELLRSRLFDFENENLFIELINTAIIYCGIAPADIAAELKVSTRIVVGYSLGRNLPYEEDRKLVLIAIRRHLGYLLKQDQPRLSIVPRAPMPPGATAEIVPFKGKPKKDK